MTPIEPVSPRSPRLTLLRSLLFSLIALLNDRLLPSDRPVDAEALWHRFQGLLAWCQRFLDQHDPGPLQYRGRPLDPQAPIATARPVPFQYRGLTVERQIPCDPATTDAPQPYRPAYQRRLQLWLLNLGLGDADRLTPTPTLDPAYRGHKI